MSPLNASLAFLPWLRSGISAAASAEAGPDGRLTVPLQVSFGPGRDASVTLGFAGAGDVTGLDPRVVVRTWPGANVHDAEPNLFPMVEFAGGDLCWRYTPAPAGGNDRLPPWICLIVLKDSEIRAIIPPNASRPLPVVDILDAPLPLLEQAWAWAHVQVEGVADVTAAEARDILATEPHRITSRLLCPRQLEAGTPYTALVVPAFASGVHIGLGLSGPPPADPLTPAWTAGTRSVPLPIYFRWRFTTGSNGDFESLVRRLRAAKLPTTVGLRPMDISDPGGPAELDDVSQQPLGFEGALRAPDTESTSWADGERVPFIQILADFLNRPTDLLGDGEGVRAVAPPLYGRWYAAENRLNPEQPPQWFQEANADPRWRAAAGLGAQVVQANQQHLMESAWKQAEGLDETNRKLRNAQFARELALRVQERHLDGGDDEFVLQVTAPVHSRILGSPTTIKSQLEASPIAEGAVGAGWRRVSRSQGPIGRRQGRSQAGPSQILGRMNRRQISPAPPPPKPAVLATPTRTGESLAPKWVTTEATAAMRATARWLKPTGAVALGFGAAMLFQRKPLLNVLAAGAVGVAALAGAARLRKTAERLELGAATRDGKLTAPAIASVAARPAFVARESALVGGTDSPSPPPVATGEDSSSARAFRIAAAAMLSAIAVDTLPAAPAQPLVLPQLRAALFRALDPHTTIGASVRDRLQLAEGVFWQPHDPLEPVLAGPDFPQPMYRYLAELSNDWILPGLDQVPSNVVSLAKTNQRFVEAFMLGLNDELGRELLWREYPSDQRRTYFKQFWDPSGVLPRPEAKLEDIEPIHHWKAAEGLGANGGRDAAAAERLVLLIRGDLIQRYPNLVVYAGRATWEGSVRVLTGEEQQPVFGGKLPPDVAFFGFALTGDRVRGASTPQGDPGWFFVLQEQPGEPRFGLDVAEAGAVPPTDWNKLQWGHLAADLQVLGTIDYINLNSELPDTRAITDPANVAWHADHGLGRTGATGAHLAYAALQRPVRVAVHASTMLPA